MRRDATRRCLGWSRTPSSGGTCATCSGSVATRCGEEARVTVDCAKLGLSCDAIAICSSEPGTACDRATFTQKCTSDGTPEFCDDGAVFHGPRCADLGLSCGAGGFCTGSGDACQDETSTSGSGVSWDGLACDGDTLQACVGGRKATRDCSSAGPGLGCQAFDGIHFCGLASECLPGEQPRGAQRGSAVRCEGSTVVFCNAGRIERVDCKTLGFDGCDEAAGVCVPGALR